MSAKTYVTLVIEVTDIDERTAIHRASEINNAILSSAYHPSLARSVQVVAEDVERHVS